MAMIETINLTKKYGELVALNNLNLEIHVQVVQRDQVTVLLGEVDRLDHGHGGGLPGR